MVQGEAIRPNPGEVLVWAGRKWKANPDGTWHMWDPKPGGEFVQLPDDDALPDEFWVWLAKRSLLGGS